MAQCAALQGAARQDAIISNATQLGISRSRKAFCGTSTNRSWTSGMDHSWMMRVVSPSLCRRGQVWQTPPPPRGNFRAAKRVPGGVQFFEVAAEHVSNPEVFRQLGGWHLLLAGSTNGCTAAQSTSDGMCAQTIGSVQLALARLRYVFELESGLLTSLEEILPPARPDTPNFDPKDGHWKTAEGAESQVQLSSAFSFLLSLISLPDSP